MKAQVAPSLPAAAPVPPASSPPLSLTSLGPPIAASPDAATLAPPAPAAGAPTLPSARVMDSNFGIEGEGQENSNNIDEEISKLLSTEAVMEDKNVAQDDQILNNDGPDFLAESAIKDEPNLGLGEEKSLAENIDTLESAKVKEAALDDKLSIELRSIVQQIQVYLFSRGFSFSILTHFINL